MSNKKTAQPQEHFRNRLCRAVGHDWQSTTSNDYRVCQRDDCHAVQRCVRGQWRSVLHERQWTDPVEAWNKRAALPQQQALF
ncbi:MAG TPA: hypothetical protein VEL31_15905 [Ktedonobacteraceae bacterium]|nr:hypothetical protein [Ktedonobacteraceae bacterium]